MYFYIFERDNKHYDPTCRLLETNGDTLADIQEALNIATRVSDPANNIPALVVTSKDNGEFIACNSPLARTLPSAERYKIVPFNPELSYKRHKVIDKEVSKV